MGASALEPGTYLISAKEELQGQRSGFSATHRGYLLTVRDGAPPLFTTTSDEPITVEQVRILLGEDPEEFILSVHFTEGEGDEAEDHVLTLAIDDDYGQGVEVRPGESAPLTVHFGKIAPPSGPQSSRTAPQPPRARGKGASEQQAK